MKAKVVRLRLTAIEGFKPIVVKIKQFLVSGGEVLCSALCLLG